MGLRRKDPELVRAADRLFGPTAAQLHSGSVHFGVRPATFGADTQPQQNIYIDNLDQLIMGPGGQAHQYEPAAAQDELARVLSQARVADGNRPLKPLAEQVGYSTSMLSRVFSGKVLPNHDVLTKLAEVLNVEMSTFTTVWKPLWVAAHGRRRPTRAATPAPASTPTVSHPDPPAAACPACGATVETTNAFKHLEWHLTADGGEPRPVSRLRLVE